MGLSCGFHERGQARHGMQARGWLVGRTPGTLMAVPSFLVSGPGMIRARKWCPGCDSSVKEAVWCGREWGFVLGRSAPGQLFTKSRNWPAPGRPFGVRQLQNMAKYQNVTFF